MTTSRNSVSRADRAIARKVALRIGLKSGRELLRPRRHNPSIEFCNLIGDEWTAEDTAILNRLRYRRFCPSTYAADLNR